MLRLTPWEITEEKMEEIKNDLIRISKLGDVPHTMNYVSFIPEILPEWVDKTKMLDLLLGVISQAKLESVAHVKLSVSTMKNVLQTLNKPTPLNAKTELIWKTLKIIKRQGEIFAKAVMKRDIFKWMPTSEIKEVATALLECLNAGLKCKDVNTEGQHEEDMEFITSFMLRAKGRETEKVVDLVKTILGYIHTPGLPSSKLDSSDKTFQIWALGDDEDNPVLNMIKNDASIPFTVSQHFLQTYSQKKNDKNTGEDNQKKKPKNLHYQVAVIKENVFPWSTSDVKSELVSLSVATRKVNEDLEQIKFLASPINVRISMDKNLKTTSVKGKALQLDPNLDPEYLDLNVQVHRIDCLPKCFIIIEFLFPQTTDSLRVILMEDYRPNYNLAASKDTVVINASNPKYPIQHRMVDESMFLYMSVLPQEKVPVNQIVDYEFVLSEALCQLWIDSQWSSIGCSVNPLTTIHETVCDCTHLSIFAAAFPVPPESIDPIGDAKLLLKVLDNPLVFVFIIIIFIIYFLTILWGLHKDKKDQYKGKVVVLRDNFPGDSFPYLVAVHTSARFNAGTTANVGIKLVGREARSRGHILFSEHRRVLKTNSDDWFMLYAPRCLGDIYAINLWHDNSGSSPEWFCEKIIVYDMIQNAEYVFNVDQWLALRKGDFPEANIMLATDKELFSLKRMFLENSILGFRDNHPYLSVFVRHPRSEVTRVQRISILMCCIMVAMLCSIMFYKRNVDEAPTDPYQYNVEMREFIVGIQTLIITALLTILVMFSFRKSYKVIHGERDATLRFRKEDLPDSISSETQINRSDDSTTHDKTFYENYVQYVSKTLKKPPFAPVSMLEGEKKVQRRLVWYIIAWLSCMFVICGSAYLVILYGLKLGVIQSEKWLTALVMSIGGDLFFFSPGKIILVAILLSMAFQVSTKVDIHGITLRDVLLAKPKNEINYLILVLARRSHPMYAPLSPSTRWVMLKKKEIRRKWWNLIDFINACFFVIVVSVVIRRLWISHYHVTHHLTNMFSESNEEQFGAVDLKHVKNITMVHGYLEITLFEILFNLRWYGHQSLATSQLEPEGIRRYWAKDNLHKMIGKPVVRQVRVIVGDDYPSKFFKPKKRLLKWSLWNKDTDVYGEKWAPATHEDIKKKDNPWKYRDTDSSLWWTNDRFYGATGILYDKSGYYTTVGPTMKAALKTLGELRVNRWQDMYTRACFLVATVYNVNDRVYSQVTVLFEYFVDGSMNTSIKVIPVTRAVLFGAWEVLFIVYAIYYVFRSGYLINRMGLMDYLKTLNNVTHVINVFLKYLAIILWSVHHFTSSKYATEYMKDTQVDQFHFDEFVHVFNFLQIVLSLLFCFAISRCFMLLRGGRKILNSYYTLIISLTWIFWLTLIFILLLFVLTTVTYFLNCTEYFRMKELVLPHKITANVRTAYFEHWNIKVFVILRILTMNFLHAFFVILFIYYARIARGYNHKESDSFNFVLFVIERIKKRFIKIKSYFEELL